MLKTPQELTPGLPRSIRSPPIPVPPAAEVSEVAVRTGSTGDRDGFRMARTIFVSDLHLGCHHSRVDEFVHFLRQHSPEKLFLVGDFLDARALRLSPQWLPGWNSVFNALADMAAAGTQIFYTPGNHDDFLREHWPDTPDVTVADEFVHTTADGRRVVILHGDQFDEVESRAHWLSLLGSFAYTGLLMVDRGMNHGLKTLGMKPRRLSRFLKQTTKRIVQRVSGFHQKVFDHARQNRGDVIVCGHIHIPGVRRFEGDRLYINLGDWVENATGLIETTRGELELVNLESDAHEFMADIPGPVLISPRARKIRDALTRDLTFLRFDDETDLA